MQAGDDEKELMQNEEENPINKKKKKSLGSIKYKVSFFGMNSASDLWQCKHPRNAAMHNEAKSPSRVHFWICVLFMILYPFFGYFMLGDPIKTPKSDVDCCTFIIIIEFENS